MPLIWLFMIWRLRVGMNLLEKLRLLPVPNRNSSNGQKRFLIIYLTRHLGDLILMLPMIERLRSAFPSARIELAVQRDVASLLSIPEVDKVWGFDLPGRSAQTALDALRLSWAVTRQFLTLMYEEPNPDVCILPRWDDDGFRSGDLAYLTRAPIRVGFDFNYLSDRLPLTEGTLTHKVARAHSMHEPLKGIYLMQAAGLLQINNLEEVSTQPIAALRSVARKADWNPLASRLGLDANDKFGVIAPGATQLRRRWPIERWAEVGRLLKEAGLRVVVLSGADDAEVSRALHEMLQAEGNRESLLVAGVTNVNETAMLLAHSRIFLGADSGPGHIAGGLGIPCVIQFITVRGAVPDGGHSPERFRPAGPRVTCVTIPHTLPPCKGMCLADRAHCILTIETEKMLDAVRQTLGLNAS